MGNSDLLTEAIKKVESGRKSSQNWACRRTLYVCMLRMGEVPPTTSCVKAIELSLEGLRHGTSESEVIKIKSPKKIADQLEKIANAWDELAPSKEFGALTLPQYKAIIQPSLDARDGIKHAKVQQTDALTRRSQNDAKAIETSLRVVSSIKGDPTEGEDSALYEACGYVPKSKRKSGLSRKAKTAGSQVKALT